MEKENSSFICYPCIHLKQTRKKEPGTDVPIYSCSITPNLEVSAMGYPWQCTDRYTANQDD